MAFRGGCHVDNPHSGPSITMNLAPLTPVVVGVVLAAVGVLGSRTRHQVVDGRLVYRFPPALAYLMFGI